MDDTAHTNAVIAAAEAFNKAVFHAAQQGLTVKVMTIETAVVTGLDRPVICVEVLRKLGSA